MTHPAACKWIAVCDVLSSSFSMNYMLCLSIEVVIKLYDKTDNHYKLKKFVYHFFALGQGVLLVVFAELNNDFGSSDIGTCSLIPTSLTEALRVYSFAVEIILMWILIGAMVKKVGKTYSNVIFNYFMVILTMTFSVTIVNALGYANKFNFKDPQTYSNLALVIGSSTGVSMGLSRLMNKRLIKQVLWKLGYKWRFRYRNLQSFKSSYDSFLNINIYNLGDLFENLHKKFFMQMLSMICLRFTEHDKRGVSIEFEPGYNQFEFDEGLFDELSSYHDLPRIKESNPYLVYNPDLILIEYQPKIFSKIRMQNQVFEVDLQRSFSIPSNLQKLKELNPAKGGSSGSTVLFTFNQEFVIKTITNSEKKLLLKILPDYSRRIAFSSSRLVRILGMFRIKPGNQDFIIMESVISSKDDAVIFDLKGSSVDRLVEGNFEQAVPYGKVLKDLNLVSSGLSLNLPDEIANELIEDLAEDFKVLSKNNIMDYSVLLGFYKTEVKPITRYDIQGNDRVYAIGIIDFLQNFNMIKKYEKYFKKMIYGEKQVSSEVPDLYMNRISQSMSTILSGSGEQYPLRKY